MAITISPALDLDELARAPTGLMRPMSVRELRCGTTVLAYHVSFDGQAPLRSSPSRFHHSKSPDRLSMQGGGRIRVFAVLIVGGMCRTHGRRKARVHAIAWAR
jgi:hypothetical protein